MKKLKIQSAFTGIAGFLLAMSVFSCSTTKPINSEKSGNNDYTVAAYVWPSTHHDARFGDMLWPDGDGEWEIIKKGNPRFDGHYQPKVPLWGYEHDDDP